MRILSIDYGKKRTGLAVTDPLQIIANGLATVSTSELFDYLKNILRKNRWNALSLVDLLSPTDSQAKTWFVWNNL